MVQMNRPRSSDVPLLQTVKHYYASRRRCYCTTEGIKEAFCSILITQRILAMDRRFSQTGLEAVSSLISAQTAICGPPTRDRLNILKLCLAVAQQGRAFK